VVRFDCGLGARIGAAALVISTLGLATAEAFPADQAMVPVAVGAAFALPAVAALIYYSMARIIRLLGGFASFAAVALIGVWIIETLSPGMTRQVVDLVGLRWGT
jgi:hypothetical protein